LAQPEADYYQPDALNIVNVVDLGMDAEKAIAQPKFHHQWKPDELRVEQNMSRRWWPRWPNAAMLYVK